MSRAISPLATYEIDRKPRRGRTPATSEEVAEIVKFAAAEKFALVATRARTKLGIGYAPPATISRSI